MREVISLLLGVGVAVCLACPGRVHAQTKLQRWGSTFNDNRPTEGLLALYTFEQQTCNKGDPFRNWADGDIPSLVDGPEVAVSCVASDDQVHTAIAPGVVVSGAGQFLLGASQFKLSGAGVYPSITVDFWVSVTPSDGNFTILGFKESDFYIEVQVSQAGGSRLRAHSATGDSYIDWTLPPFDTDQHHHIVVAYDAGANTGPHSAYCDNVLLDVEEIYYAGDTYNSISAIEGAPYAVLGVTFLSLTPHTLEVLYSSAPTGDITLSLLSIYGVALTSTQVESSFLAGLPHAVPVLAPVTVLSVEEDTPREIQVSDFIYGDTDKYSVVLVGLPRYGRLTTSASNTSVALDSSALGVLDLWRDDKPLWYHPASDFYGQNLDAFQVSLVSNDCIKQGNENTEEQCTVAQSVIRFNIEGVNDAPATTTQRHSVFVGALMEFTIEFEDVDILPGSSERLTVQFHNFGAITSTPGSELPLSTFDDFTTRYNVGACNEGGRELFDDSRVYLEPAMTSLTICFNSTGTASFHGTAESVITYSLEDASGAKSGEGRSELEWLPPLRACYADKTGECETTTLHQGVIELQSFEVVAYDMRQPSERTDFEYEFLFYEIDRSATAGTVVGLGDTLDSSTTVDGESHFLPAIQSPDFLAGTSNKLAVSLSIIAAPNFYSVGPSGERVDLNGRDVTPPTGSILPVLVYRLRALEPANGFRSRALSDTKELMFATRPNDAELPRIGLRLNSVMWAGPDASPFSAVVSDSKPPNDFSTFRMNVTCGWFKLTTQTFVWDEEPGLREIETCSNTTGCLSVLGTTQALNRVLSDGLRLHPTDWLFEPTACNIAVGLDASADNYSEKNAKLDSNALFVKATTPFLWWATLVSIVVGALIFACIPAWHPNYSFFPIDESSQLKQPNRRVPSMLIASEIYEDNNNSSSRRARSSKGGRPRMYPRQASKS